MRRPLAIVASMVLAGVSVGAVVGAGPALAQVPAAQADYRGYSTGSVNHIGVLRAGTTQLVDTEVAFSGATVASQGTGGVTFGPGAAAGTVVNEFGQVVQPALPDAGDANLRGNRSFGRGSGLEVGLANNLPNDSNQIILAQRARASAPPSTGLITREVGPIKLDGVAFASLLRGQAQARFRDDRNCLIGQPLSLGLGYADNTQLLGSGGNNDIGFDAPTLATDAPSPERRVSQSRSITQIIPQVDANGTKLGDNFGLMTETRMTIAPVTLFKGTPTQLTIELLGEWVLRTVATGVGGAAGNYVTYGPGTVSPETPVVRIISGLNPALGNITQVTLQQLLGPTGLVVPIPGVAEVAIGEDPRAIGGNANSSPQIGSDGTVAAAGVDVVRVTLLDGSLADVRIGHMESRAQVPAGGIQCTLPVTKTADKQQVNAGDSFVYTITVENPFADCTLENVRIVDTIEVPRGVNYSVTGTNPAATVAGNVVTFDNIGSIPPNGSKAATVTIAVAANSGSGLFTNRARATGTCATGTGQGEARITVPAFGEVVVQLPQAGAGGGAQLPATGVDSVPTQPTGSVLPRTGGSSATPILLGGMLLALAFGVRRVLTRAQ